MIQLFDKMGRFTTDGIDPAEVALLTPQQQTFLAVVIESSEDAAAAEARLVAAKQNVRHCQRVECECLEANARANPAPSRLEVTRAAQAAYRSSH
jgi:hypothetical protein